MEKISREYQLKNVIAFNPRLAYLLAVPEHYFGSSLLYKCPKDLSSYQLVLSVFLNQ